MSEENIPIVGNDYDEVPMDVKLLSDLKLKMEDGAQLADLANRVGIEVVRAISNAATVGQMVTKKEAEVNAALENAIVVSGVEKDDFVGYDLNRGTIRVKKAVLN